MASQDEQYKLNSKLLEDLLSIIASDLLGGVIVPKGDFTLHDLVEYPAVEEGRATREEVDALVNFVCSHLSYKVKDKTITDGFLGKNLMDIVNDERTGRSVLQAKLKEVIENPFKHIEFGFEPRDLSEDEKKKYVGMLGKIYGVDKLERGGKIPIRLKDDVIKNPLDYLRTDVNFEKIYNKHKAGIDSVLADYAANLNKGPEQETGGGIDELVPCNIEGVTPPHDFGKAGWFSRFWHTNPFSQFGELYRRAKVNMKRLAKGKIKPWKETFDIEGKRYNLHNPAELGSLPDKEKIYLGKEYKKRKLHDWLVIAAIVAGFIPEVTGFGLWIHDKYFKKIENPPAPWDYIWPDRPKPKIVEEEARPSQPAPEYTEAGCRDNCKDYFSCPEAPECVPKTRIEFRDRTSPSVPTPPAPSCPCTGRVRELR